MHKLCVIIAISITMSPIYEISWRYQGVVANDLNSRIPGYYVCVIDTVSYFCYLGNNASQIVPRFSYQIEFYQSTRFFISRVRCVLSLWSDSCIFCSCCVFYPLVFNVFSDAVLILFLFPSLYQCRFVECCWLVLHLFHHRWWRDS